MPALIFKGVFMLLWLARILLWIPLSILHPTFIRNRKKMPKGKAIISCNHRSNWDIALYILNTREKIKILAKKELFKNRLFGAILKNFGAIVVDRNQNDVSAIKNCIKVLKDGKKLFIFPEGTRLKNEDEIIGEIKSGMTMIAIKTKTPIVPVWVNRKPKAFRKSVYTIGDAFELTDFYNKKLDEETLNEANNFVREKMLALRESTLKKSNKK